jgi:hypothetical protein
VWFERGKIEFPYGDDTTRRVVNEMLEELESHAWKSGDIVDTGKHNDLVMALAHAIDQFSFKSDTVPFAGRSMGKGAWQGGKSKSRSRGGIFRAVSRRL